MDEFSLAEGPGHCGLGDAVADRGELDGDTRDWREVRRGAGGDDGAGHAAVATRHGHLYSVERVVDHAYRSRAAYERRESALV